MLSKSVKALIALSLILVLAPIVYGHTPLFKGHGNHDIDSALEISNPTKSWVLYRSLHEAGEPEYFSIELSGGQRLVLSLLTPLSEEEDFAPNLVVMGPALSPSGRLPESMEVPEGYGAVLIEGVRTEPEYEPFSPGSYYFTAGFDLTVQDAGIYYAVVYEPDGDGRYGMAVGYREVFTLLEWLMVPFETISIHQWEGQTLFFILAPIFFTLIIGIFLSWRAGIVRSPLGATGVLSGLLFAGSGVYIMYQMGLALMSAPSGAALITLIFALLPLALGFLIVKWVRDGLNVASIMDRARLVVFGLLGFLFWAGFLLGPSLIILLGLFAPLNVASE